MLSIGIVGLPNVGKSTLFNALTGRSVPAENYPFCTIDPSVGVVGVPDARLTKLSAFSRSEKTIPAAIEFTDIAGLVAGASKGEGLGNQFLAHIREVDAIAEVVRAFEDANITHVHGKINPLHDIEVINLELMLRDMETVSRRKAGIEKEVKRGDKEAKKEHELLERTMEALESGEFARTLTLSHDEEKIARGLHLLTMKPVLYIVNIHGGNSLPVELEEFFKKENALWLALDLKTEHELSGVAEDERVALRKDLGVSDEGLDELIQKGYALLDLITFFTTGPSETRAWTVRRDSTAPEAGRAIHSDFHDKFIRAEVINWEELLGAGSYPVAREQGVVRTVGKEYVVKDGDVIEFKI